MISHFQWKEIRNNLVRQEWAFSFYYQGQYLTGSYHKDGSMTWGQPTPSVEQRQELEPRIHDLMLYHVYEEH
ncbi:YheE family protein [Bacillus sp. FJAT-45037]|uniref:YheE family protein n=1 Tax=Bacillus sp. FJAT-45037 TaxID=2011007 RepID=UPI000C2515C1|nr:YheE family protein [Bacillus sp. FJAT-45037]